MGWSRLPRQIAAIWLVVFLSVTLVAVFSVQFVRHNKRRAEAELEEVALLLLDTIELAMAQAPPPRFDATRTTLRELANQHDEILSAVVFDAAAQEMTDVSSGASPAKQQVELISQLAETGTNTLIQWTGGQLLAARAISGEERNEGALIIAISTEPVSSLVEGSQAQALTAILSTAAIGSVLAIVLSRSKLGLLNGSSRSSSEVDTAENVSESHLVAEALSRSSGPAPQAGQEHHADERTRALLENEHLFRKLVSSISDVVYIAKTDANHILCYGFISPRIEQLTGHLPSAFIEDPELWSSAVHPADQEAYISHSKRFSAGSSSEIEYRILHTDGSSNWVRDSGRVATTDPASTALVFGVVSVITARYRVDREREHLLKSEREQRLLAESLTEVTLALTSQIGLDGLLDEILRQAKRIVPFTVASVSLLEHGKLKTVRWLSDEPMLAERAVAGLTERRQLYPDVTKVIQSGESIVFPDTWQADDWTAGHGREWVRSYLAVPLDHQERVLGLLHLDSETAGQFTEEDVKRLQPLANAAAIAIENARLVDDLADVIAERTADVQTEQGRSETVLRNVKDAIVMSGLDGQIQYVNQAFNALTGFSTEEVLGKQVETIGTAAGWVESASDLLSKGHSWQGEVEARRKDGSSYDAALTLAPVLSVNGTLLGYIATHRDISEDRALERARSRFMTNVSHQLRTPVTNIKLYMDLLSRADSSEQRARYIEVVTQQSDRLENLVQDILELTSLDGGQVATERRPVSLESLVEIVVSRHQRLAEDAGVTLESTTTAPELPQVIADEIWLARALGELTNNAIKFTPAGGTVELLLRTVDRDGESWHLLEVRDNGPGIPLEEQEHIFDRFYRGTVADAGDIPGTGLGLSIALAILQTHGGDLSVKSIPGEGSVFTLQLPAV